MQPSSTLAQKIARLYLPILETYYRAKFIGLENIPSSPFLGVGNHLGVYFMPESFLWMAKYHSMNFKVPMKILVHHIFKEIVSQLKLPTQELGILDANPSSALNALQSGNAVTVYPGGDKENSKPFKDRYTIDFYDHLGYIELAIKAKVPILPIVGIGGGETLFVLSSGEKIAEITGLRKRFKIHTWPIYWSFPLGIHIGHFPYFSIPLPSQVTISVLPPYSLESYSSEDANNKEVLIHIHFEITKRMQKEMDKLAKGRIPIIGKL